MLNSIKIHENPWSGHAWLLVFARMPVKRNSNKRVPGGEVAYTRLLPINYHAQWFSRATYNLTRKRPSFPRVFHPLTRTQRYLWLKRITRLCNQSQPGKRPILLKTISRECRRKYFYAFDFSFSWQLSLNIVRIYVCFTHIRTNQGFIVISQIL